MSVRKNVGFGLTMQGIKGAEADKRISDALALVRLESQADKLPGQLSGGQQQRVAIARAVVIRPPIVLMDEPLSNLDAKLRLEMRAEIRGIHDQIGSTTIYVTHDQDEALSLADRIVVMSQGHIEQIGSPQELYQQPVNLDVADFMGFRTRIAGRIVSVSGDAAEIDAAGARMTGRMRAPLQVGDAAVLSVRPEDLVAAPGGGIPATVASMEYRGRAFFGMARGADGAELYFRADSALPRGASTTLQPVPGHALLFKGSQA
jgi:putative spermidine/putrescine transport system ATP-binding protein